MLIKEQMRKYKVKMEEINQLEAAESIAFRRLSLLRQNAVSTLGGAWSGAWLGRWGEVSLFHPLSSQPTLGHKPSCQGPHGSTVGGQFPHSAQ